MSPRLREAIAHRGADLLAGVSVALVLVPQSLAYAELAGMPPARGLLAAALPPIFAALFASSPYLQTGPTALTSLLSFGALASLATPGSDRYVALAGLLALAVGATRLALGMMRGGRLSYLISQPALQGFTVAAALLIVSSQLPAALGVSLAGHGVIEHAARAVRSVDRWQPAAIGLTAFTLLAVLGARKLHPLFPGVLVAVVIGVVYGSTSGHGGEAIGPIPSVLFAPFPSALPWGDLPRIAVSGAIIGLVGFAEVASISQTLSERTRRPWDPDRELRSQGVANLVAGLVGAFPVGGSFARSAISHLAGAKSRWSGAFAGLAVLLFVPFASVLAPLPKAVLSGIVIASVLGLLWPARLVRMFRDSPLQGSVGVLTFVLTLSLAPHIEYAVLGGVVLAMAVHVYREQRVDLRARFEGGVLHLQPMGVVWFGSAPLLREQLVRVLSGHDDVSEVRVDLSAVGRIDLSGALALCDVHDIAREAGLAVRFDRIPPHAQRIMRRVCPPPEGPLSSAARPPAWKRAFRRSARDAVPSRPS